MNIGKILGATILAGIVLLVGLVGTIQAGPSALTWSALVDQSSAYAGTYSLRGVAVSSDGVAVYTTWIQQSPTYRRIRKYSTSTSNNLLAEFTLPASPTDPTNCPAGREQAKSIAADDRGYVYVGTGDRCISQGVNPYILVLNSGLTPAVSGPVSTADAATMQKRIGGADVWKSSGKYYLYISREGGTGSAYIQRFDVTDPANPALDTTFNGTGTFNLASLSGFSTAGFPRGLEVADDGTIYLTSSDTSNFTNGVVYKIASDLSSALSATVLGAMDVGLYAGKAYVTQYLANNSAIAVLDAGTLALVETITIPAYPHANTSGDNGYSGIDIGSDRKIYVADQLYDTSSSLYRDRLLVSSRLPVPQCTTVCYVDAVNGDDANGGTSTLDAKRTIQAGVTQVSPGGTVHVASGTYSSAIGEVFPITINRPVTVVGDPSGSQPDVLVTAGTLHAVEIRANNVTLENLHLYQADHPSDAALVYVPWGGTWPNLTIDYSGLTIRNCVLEGGRYGTYLSVANLTVEDSCFLNNYRDGLITAGVSGTTSIRDNHFIGDGGTYAGKKAIYMTTGSGTPWDSGTVDITGNICTGRVNFFVIDHWNGVSQPLSLTIAHNSVDSLLGPAISFAAATGDPTSFQKLSSITIRDNIVSNSGRAVFVDYQWGATSNNPVPGNDQIVVKNNLTYNLTGSGDVTDPTGSFGFDNSTSGTPAGASMNMFALSGNVVGDPLWANASHPGACQDPFDVVCFSPALDAASDGTNIGAWQGSLICDNQGPVTSAVAVSPNPARPGENVVLTAVVDDSGAGGSVITAAEYSLDGGPWTPMAAQDGAFDSSRETVTASFAAPTNLGRYQVCVRAVDAAGNVGQPVCTLLVVFVPGGAVGGVLEPVDKAGVIGLLVASRFTPAGAFVLVGVGMILIAGIGLARRKR